MDPRSLTFFGVALILHSIVDGLAIGVFKELANITVLAVSVIIHKIPVACTLGTTFLSNGGTLDQCQTKVVFILFILASPLGMIIGIIAAEMEGGLVLMVIQALSGGIFIYLACCDLIIH
jgi:zinc transporter 1/2/3